MARSRRPSAPRRMRVKKDWVYTQQGYPVDNVVLNGGGSVDALALPLTISQSARREITFGSPGVEPQWTDLNQYQTKAAVPEGAGLRVYAVECTLIVLPQDWALSTFYRLGIRLIHGVMSNFDGELSIEAGYSMWEGTTPDTINQWANAGFLKEWYKAESWSGAVGGLVTRTHFVYNLRWRSTRGIRLANDRAIFLYLESDFNSRVLSIWPRCRALVSATAP